MTGHAIHIKLDGRTYSGTYKVDRQIPHRQNELRHENWQRFTAHGARHPCDQTARAPGARGERP